MSEAKEGDRWIILRTTSGKTLGLAASLREDGYEAWTPTYQREVRVPRANVRRRVTLPLTPTFIFVRAIHLHDMLSLAAMPERPRRGAGGRQAAHAGFWVFHDRDRVPAISDAALEPLRRSEAKAVPIKRRSVFQRGARVSAPGGAFAGLEGVVERSDGKCTVVRFGDRLVVKIDTFILKSSEVQNVNSR